MFLKLSANHKIAQKCGNGGIPAAYANFDLLIHRSGDKYTARVINSPAGESSIEIVPPTSVMAPQDLFADLSQTAKTKRSRHASAQKAIKTLGKKLFDTVFEEAIHGCLQSSLNEANQKGQGLRLRLHLVDTPELAALPWELLYNSALNQFLSLSVKTPLVRYIDLPASLQPWEIKPPLRVLVMISSPVDYPGLQIEREWDKLKDAFQGLESRGLAQLERLEAATLDALQTRLQNGEYHIFHFIGHGVFDRKAQDGLLILENENELGDPVNGERLGILLHDHPSLRLALLNACEGARGDGCDMFTGLAQRFVQQGLPAVIAMQFPVSDETAITLSHVFYETLSKGLPVDAALTEARKAVFTQVNEAEWAAPVLFMRSPDGRIFDYAHSQEPMPTNIATVAEPAFAQPVPPARKRNLKLVPMGIALTVLLLAFFAYKLISRPAPKMVSPKVVAVLPFAVTGSEEYADFGKGMVDLLSTNLDGTDELRSVDPRALLGYVAKKRSAEFAPEQCSKIAARFGAGLFVLGNITEAMGRLRIHATLYECNNGPQILAQAQVEGEIAELFNLVDQLAAQLLASLSFAPSAEMRRIAVFTTGSLPAFKAYLEGENAFEEGDFEQAAASLQRAVQIDTAFALAYYRLSVVDWWLDHIANSQAAAEKAVRYSDRLSARERRLLQASLAVKRGATVEAEQLFRGILDDYPDEVEALWQMGEVLFHGGPLRGRPIAESREYWERVLELKPTHIFAALHLSRLAALEGKRAELDTLTQYALALQQQNEPAFEIQVLRVFALQDKAQQLRMLEALRQRPAATVLHAVWNLAVYCGDLLNAKNVARLLTLPPRPHQVRAVGHVVLAHLALAQGRWKAAQMELAKAEQLDRATGIEYRALFSAMPFLPVTASNLAAICGGVEQLETNVAATPAKDYFGVHDDLHPHLRLYLLGLLSIRLGQGEAAIEYANALEQLDGAPVAITLASDLSQSLRAQVTRDLAQPADALVLLEQNKMESSYELAVVSSYYARSYERYLRASLLRELGRLDEALNWYNSFGEFSVFDLACLAPAHLQRGEIYETMGENEQAIQHYTRFITLWKNCDPELKPMIINAETRLAQLK